MDILMGIINDFGVFIIFGVVIVGIFVAADIKVKRDNQKEYERTGIRQSYSNVDASRYVFETALKIMRNWFSSTY